MGLFGPAHALDVNQATVEQLEAMRGLGAKTAALIVKERARGGPFESMDNLAERVKGLGVKKARVLEASGLRAGAESPATPGGTPSSATDPRSAPKANRASGGANEARPGGNAAGISGQQVPPKPRRPMQAPASATLGRR